MTVHITPDGIGQAAMLGMGALGVGLLIDTWQYVNDGTSFLSSFGVLVNIDERARALMTGISGVMLLMYAAGIWTVQVGAAAIVMMLALASGQWWSYTSERGTAAYNVTTTAITTANNSQQPHKCYLTEQQLQWCTQDTDGDGISNQFDSDFNQNGEGRRNCANGYRMTTEACS